MISIPTVCVLPKVLDFFKSVYQRLQYVSTRKLYLRGIIPIFVIHILSYLVSSSTSKLEKHVLPYGPNVWKNTFFNCKNAVVEWQRLFPRQVTETYTSSVTFMKQLTVIAISTITYLKNVFPEESYILENFGGIKLRVLKQKCRDETAHFVSTALMQAFEAFDKKYLHQLAICFYDGECKVQNLMEYHIFEYLYNADGTTMNVHSKTRDSVKSSTRFSFENVRGRTLNLIKKLVTLVQAYENDIPKSLEISLRLYYNEDAPEGYQAPGYLSEEHDHLEPTLQETVRMGQVETPYHTMIAHTYVRESMLVSSHDAIPSQNIPKMTESDQDDFGSGSAMKSESDGREVRIQCPCNKFDADELSQLLTCHYCSSHQHAACFGLSRENAARVQRHCCTECSDTELTREPTDQRLASYSFKKRECLCIFRRTLDWCSRVAAIRAQDLVDKFTLSPVNASKMMKLLYSHGIIDQGSNSDLFSPCEIIQDKLNAAKEKYFQYEEPDLVDRLIAETLSQSSQADPVAQVLSPMEKVNLQNATTLGKIIQPEPVRVVEDETLKQYRSAIMCDYGLPLCNSPNPVNVEDSSKRAGKRKSTRAKRTAVQTKRARASRD